MANGAPTVSNGLVISGVTTSTNVSVASSVTATTFYGSGSNLTGITQTTINNNADNRIITGSGTANTLEGESNLTFDGTNLSIPAGLIHTGDTDTKLEFGTDTVKLFTAGVQKFRIYDDGVVSIGQSSKSSTVGAGNLDIQGNATNCIIEMGNPFPGFSGGVVPEFRITATNSGHEVKFESIWGGDNALHPHMAFTGGKTHFYRATNSDEIATFNGANFGINETSADTKLHISHSNATEDVIKLEATPVSAGTGERSRMIFQITQSNGQSAKLGHIASHSLNNWGGELVFHTKPANGTPNNTTNEVMRMHANGYITQPSQPSFSAHYSVNSGWSVSNGSVMNFNTTRHNTGSHYSTSNYRFTAPVNGHYEFAFYSIYNSDLNNSSNGAVNMRINGSTVSKGGRCHFTKDGSSWDHVSYSVIYYLNASDYVDIVNDGGQTINYHGGSWSGFTGQLLS